MAEANTTYTLVLNEAEKRELLQVLENILAETHSEARRTDNLEFRAELHQEESTLKSLLAKMRQLG